MKKIIALLLGVVLPQAARLANIITASSRAMIFFIYITPFFHSVRLAPSYYTTKNK